jgi:hypothetical protein
VNGPVPHDGRRLWRPLLPRVPAREIRDAAGFDDGDLLSVVIELDDEPRTVEIPPELAAALAAEPEAREAFDRLSYTHRREYVEWVTARSARRPAGPASSAPWRCFATASRTREPA